MQAVDGRRPLESNDNFLAWYQQDKRDTAEVLELPFNPHPDYPLRPSRALRAAIFAAENNRAESFVQKVMRGYWSDESDISDIGWLAATAEACGLDGSAIESIVSSEAYKDKLNQNLAEAVNGKLFGLPATVLDGKIYFGNDRLDLLERHLVRAD